MGDTRSVGLIGLGAMGQGMASSLRADGFAVHVHDNRRDVVQAFVAQGGVACESPAEVARQCQVVISVVVNAAQTEAVLFGPQGTAAAMARERARSGAKVGTSQVSTAAPWVL